MRKDNEICPKYDMPMGLVRELRAKKSTKAFVEQKRNAKSRGIGWELTLKEWWGIWDVSGKYGQRGCFPGAYQMGRNMDVGPYAVGNVCICTVQENMIVRSSHTIYKHNPKRAVCFPERSKGSVFRARNTKGSWTGYYGKRYVGSFRSEEEAKRNVSEFIARMLTEKNSHVKVEAT
jgi:hypothetical protein